MENANLQQWNRYSDSADKATFLTRLTGGQANSLLPRTIQHAFCGTEISPSKPAEILNKVNTYLSRDEEVIQVIINHPPPTGQQSCHYKPRTGHLHTPRSSRHIVNKIVLSLCSLTASMSADPGSLTVGEFLKFRSLILSRYYSIHLLRTRIYDLKNNLVCPVWRAFGRVLITHC